MSPQSSSQELGPDERSVPAWTRWAWPLAVLLLTPLAFLPAFGAEFLNYDDQAGIQLNRSFRGLTPGHLGWMFSTGKLGHYQPLSWVTLGLDHMIWGMDARGYHATNVILHSLTAVATYFLALRLTRIVRGAKVHSSGERLAAAVAALAFSVHPLRVESVAWVTERRDVLSGLFFVLTLIMWLRTVADTRPTGVRIGPALASVVTASVGLVLVLGGLDLTPDGTLGLGPSGWVRVAAGCVLMLAGGLGSNRSLRWEGARPSGRYVTLAVLCMLLSLCAKAWGMVLPALLLTLDAWPLARGRGDARLARIGALLVEKLPFGLLAVPSAVLAAWAQRSQGATMLGLGEHTLMERVTQALYGLAFYPRKTLLPTDLVPFHDLPDQVSLLEARFALSALAVVALTIFLLLNRKRAPAACTAWFLFAITVAPVLGFAQSGPQLVAERYSYLACLPLSLLFGGWVAVSMRGDGVRRFACVGAALVMVVIWGVVAVRQTRHWRDSEALWSHTLEVIPNHPSACMGMAEVWRARADAAPDNDERRAALFEALELFMRADERSDDLEIERGLAVVHLRLSETMSDAARREHHVAAALEHSRSTLERARAVGYRRIAICYLLYGRCLILAGQSQRAIEPIKIYLGIRPRDADARSLLGLAYEGVGDRAQAIEAYRRTLAREPGHPTATQRLRVLGD